MNEQSPNIQMFQEQQEDEIYLKEFWVALKRRWWIILSAFVVVLGLSVAYLMITPKQYTATAMVTLPTRGSSGGLAALALGSFLQIGSSGNVMAEVEKIKGRKLARNIIQELELDKKEQNLKLDPRQVVMKFRASLRVSQHGTSYLIKITAVKSSPKEAKDIANAVAKEYIRMSKAANEKQWDELIERMGNRLEEVEVDLVESRRLLYEREAEQGITTAFGPLLIGGGTSIQTRAGGFGTQYMILEALQAVAQLKGGIIEMEVRLELLRQSLPEAHPSIINLKDQIAVSRQKLTEEQEKAIEKYNKQFELTKSAANVVLGQQLYTTLVVKHEELKAQYLMQNRLSEIAEEAVEPLMHSKPNGMLTLMVGAFMGLFLGVGAALFREFIDKTIYTSQDVTRFIDLPVIGRIPRLRGVNRRFIARRRGKKGPGREALITTINSTQRERRRAIYRESYRMLQLEMMASVNGKVEHVDNIQYQGALTLLVTSSVSGEGKSLVAANLAVSIAQTGRKVLLVDANCRSSIQHELLDVDNGMGLIDVLTENAAWADVVKNTFLDNLYLITTGSENSQADPSMLLMSPGFDDFIKASKEQFDFVIFDSAPVTSASESVAIGSKTDGVMLVIKANGTRRDDILEAKRRIQNSGGNTLGAVLNC